MQFTTEVNWTLLDFAAELLLFGTNLYAICIKKVSTSYRIVICGFADNSSPFGQNSPLVFFDSPISGT
jgi:hypothetical protein